MTLYIAVKPRGSKFAKTLQAALRDKVVNKIFRVDHQTAEYKAARFPRRHVFQITPRPKNKLAQFKAFKDHDISSPVFEASGDALAAHGKRTWFARTLLNSTNGRGIVEFDYPGERDIPNAPLYTQYIPKKTEYRIHVFGSSVIDVQQKKKRRDFSDENRNTRIRNLANGYVYTRDGVSIPSHAADLAVRAVAALGYTYGAVDMVYNEKQDRYFVLEVNSRPGLMGTTVDKYVDALINLFNLERK